MSAWFGPALQLVGSRTVATGFEVLKIYTDESGQSRVKKRLVSRKRTEVRGKNSILGRHDARNDLAENEKGEH
jgi:hypothetical protein